MHSRIKTGEIDFSMNGGKYPLTTIFLECAGRQKYVENDIGWSRTLELSCSQKLYLY